MKKVLAILAIVVVPQLSGCAEVGIVGVSMVANLLAADAITSTAKSSHAEECDKIEYGPGTAREKKRKLREAGCL